MQLWVVRVATDDNIADLPSRPSATNFAFMESIGAVEVDPFLPLGYYEEHTWEIMHERWCALGL